MTDSTSSLCIDHLARHRAWAPRLAAWHHAQWGHLCPGDTVEDRLRRLEATADREGKTPAVLVAHDGRRPLGSASLVPNDLVDRPDLTPWLASVFVDPDVRRKGVGKRLVLAVMDYARTLGYREIHLITPDRADFYTRLGWHEIERRPYRGEQVTVMRAVLAAR